MKPATRYVVTAAVVALAATLLVPYWNAAAMILRAAGTKGLVGEVARWEARPVSDFVQRIATRDGIIRARVFRPSGHVHRAVLLVSGVHPDGVDEKRLVDLARDLAGTGVNVVTPEIRDLTEYRLTARVTDTIEDAALWVTASDDLSGGTAVGMIGVSFSGGLSIVAAGRPALRDHVSYVLSFGGHGSLPRVLRFLCTGVEPSLSGGPGQKRTPHDYALAIVLHQAADVVVPIGQVATLRGGIETFLRASALARTDPSQAVSLFLAARAQQQQMPEPSATLMKHVNDRNVAALGSRLLPYLDALGQDPSLSPDRSAPPRAPVYLLHGIDDNVIPAVESALLSAELQRSTRVRYLLSGFLSHVDVADRPTLREAGRMIAFWQAAMAEQPRQWDRGLAFRDWVTSVIR